MYLADEEGMRSAGGGMFSNIFRMHGERMGAGANIGINKVRCAHISHASLPA